MGITINGSSAAGNIDLGTNGTITDLAVGGLPDGTVDGDSVSTIPASKLTGALPAISGASLTGISSPLSFRNLLYNGQMSVCQRNTSLTSITGSNDGVVVHDRWKYTLTDAGTWSVEQVEDAPAGFAYSAKIKCTTAATFGASGRVYLEQLIEGQDQQRYKYGTGSAESLTLSFWIKSSRTGTFNAGLTNQGARSGSPSGTEIADRATSQLVTISSANTWEKKTVTFAGDTGAYIRNTTTKGVGLRLAFNAGSTYTGGAAQSWGSATNANTYTGTLGLGTATNDDLFITGVQLEVGTTATSFEYKSYTDEFLNCARYCWVVENGSAGSTAFPSGVTFGRHPDTARWIPTFPVQMRSAPSVTGTGVFKIYDTTATNTFTIGTSGTCTGENISRWSSIISFSNGVGDDLSYGNAGQLYGDGTNAAKVVFNAEL